VRLTDETNAQPHLDRPLTIVRRGSRGAPLVLAIGPTLDPVLEATEELDTTVAYATTVRPFPARELRAALQGAEVALVEPTLAGTSSAEVSIALQDMPHRLLALGVRNVELRRYGTKHEHRAAHGLDAGGLRRSLEAFLDSPALARGRRRATWARR